MNEPKSSSKHHPFILAILGFFCLVFISAKSYGDSKHYRFTGFNDEQWGLGVFLGDPIGLKTYYFTNWKDAVVFSGGYSSSKTLQVSADYLFYGYRAQDKVLDREFWIITAPPSVLCTNYRDLNFLPI